jgi:glutathione S-transferase
MFSLADVAMAPMVNRIEVLSRPQMIAPAKRPKVADWWAHIQARPGYQTAFSFKNPDTKDPVKR